LILKRGDPEYGGEMYRLLFAKTPYLVVDVWVYYLEPDRQPNIRSFIQYEMDDEAHRSLVSFCSHYPDDLVFAK
jgi:hypothetical protein